MQRFFEDTISESDVEALLFLERTEKRQDFISSMAIPSFKRICDIIEQNIPEKPIWGKPSYYRIENRHKAHPKHYDGCRLDMTPNHMSWCRYSAVSVLTKGWKDGELIFHNPHNIYHDELYLSTVLYSSASDNNPQLHERRAHDGSRYALLMFLAMER